jgi:hypothetical protein
MTTLKSTALAVAAILGCAMLAGQAAAMPADGLAAATKEIAGSVERAAYGCGPYRCWRRPGPYWGGPYYAYYGGGPYWHRPWGWGGWGWHRWGWHRHWW